MDDAVLMLKKTIEKNPKDAEAYKLIAQILIKQGHLDEATEILTKALDDIQNGDLYYLMAKIFELNEDFDSYKDSLELAYEHKDSLTFNVGAVKNEIKQIEKSKHEKKQA